MAAASLAACDGKEKADLNKRLSEASDKLVECRRETTQLRAEVAGLKRQLATALANPGKITLTDPEIINLIASIRGGGAPAGGPPKGALDPAQASKVVQNGAMALRQCYERALKRNQNLQFQAGLAVTLNVTVAPQGSVQDVALSPSVDNEMTSCIRQAAMRWKFPTFSGEAVTIEQKLTLTPTKT
ncbi:MAG TPA: AgmX/PglI C-terminal domain-containing protein [Polyangia bacterium]